MAAAERWQRRSVLLLLLLLKLLQLQLVDARGGGLEGRLRRLAHLHWNIKSSASGGGEQDEFEAWSNLVHVWKVGTR